MKHYLVGGAVRDMCLGIPSKDLDYVVNAPSFKDMRQYILDLGGKIYLEKPEYLTIRAKLNGEDADFVVCRKDGHYSDGRRPDSVEVGTLLEDLARRDATCNAMAFTLEEGIYDPFGGQNDIKKRKFKFVGAAEKRIQEDYLRILRAMRFCITKKFHLDEEAEFCLNQTHLISGLSHISKERIYEELHKCFSFSTLDTINFLDKFSKLKQHLFIKVGVELLPTLKKKKKQCVTSS